MKVADRGMFCVAPFVTLSLSTHGDVRFCCKNPVSIGNHKRQSFEEIWNSAAMKAVRMDFVRGIKTPSCRHCWDLEAAGATQSWRKTLNERFWDQLDGIVEAIDTPDGALPYQPRYLEMALSNLCNLRCRMCHPEVSSSLAGIWGEVADIVGQPAPGRALHRAYDDFATLQADFRAALPSLDQVYFFGGEPLMEKHFLTILAELKPYRDSIKLSLNTNLTKIRHGEIDLLAEFNAFKTCYLSISIDGDRRRNEYIRAGSDNFVLEDNYEILRDQYPNIKVAVTIAVQAVNILYWAETITYIARMINPYYYETSLVIDQKFLSVQALPLDLKQEAAARIEAFNRDVLPDMILHPMVDRARLAEIAREAVRLMWLEDTHAAQWPVFCAYMNKMDAVNHADMLATVPEFEPYWRR